VPRTGCLDIFCFHYVASVVDWWMCQWVACVQNRNMSPYYNNKHNKVVLCFTATSLYSYTVAIVVVTFHHQASSCHINLNSALCVRISLSHEAMSVFISAGKPDKFRLQAAYCVPDRTHYELDDPGFECLWGREFHIRPDRP